MRGVGVTVLIGALALGGIYCAAVGAARGDVFILKSGGRVEGDLVNKDEVAARQYVVRTADGGQITLARAQVVKVVRPTAAELEYENRSAQCPDTDEGHWNLARWCGENGLAKQREVHLRRILERSPDHEQARRALGFIKKDGQWTTEDQERRKDGMVRYRGRWMTEQEVELWEHKRKNELAEKEWFTKIKRWRDWVDKANRAVEGKRNILAIDDPFAIKAIVSFYKNEKSREIKFWYIEVLGRIATGDALGELVKYSLADADQEIYLACFEALAKRKSPELARMYVQALKDKDNQKLNRAAMGLRYTGDKSAIGPLIDALVTTHTYLIIPQGNSDPGAITSTFQRPGSGGGSRIGGLGVGAPQPRRVQKTFQNDDVLETLVRLAGVNHAFQVSDWKRWYAAQRKTDSLDARRD